LIVSYLPDPERHPLWEGIRGLLEPAVTDAPVLEKNELVWIAIDGPQIVGAGTTVLNNDGTAEILACGGVRHREWVNQALEAVESWARGAGASRLTMRGRRGWLRHVRRFGWDATGTEDGQMIFEKDLS
jgi:hypothetical protein